MTNFDPNSSGNGTLDGKNSTLCNGRVLEDQITIGLNPLTVDWLSFFS